MSQRVLVFDTETTGLFPKRYGSDPLDPYAIQISYIIYENGKIVETWNNYIRVPESAKISQEIETLTGISNNLCKTNGIAIVDALSDFIHAYSSVDLIVAHNIEFDKRVILTEIRRNASALISKLESSQCLTMFTNNFITPHKPAEFCTIEASRNLCAIVRTNSRGTYFKNPTLTELHEYLFGTKPANAHNSLDDCESCLRCYIELVKKN
jgi:DNA polymerase-3 subunit alpha